MTTFRDHLFLFIMFDHNKLDLIRIRLGIYQLNFCFLSVLSQ